MFAQSETATRQIEDCNDARHKRRCWISTSDGTKHSRVRFLYSSFFVALDNTEGFLPLRDTATFSRI